MGNTISREETEYQKLFNVFNFRLPHHYKWLGILGAFSILLFLIGYKFLGSNDLVNKDFLRTAMLLFLFLATMSRDKVEDEYKRYLRYQSYVISFVFAVGYAIVLPLLSFLLEVLIVKVSGDGDIGFYKLSSFEVIFMLLGFQLLIFETLKKFSQCSTD